MSDEKGKGVTTEPPTVVIELGERGQLSRESSKSRKSSTSTSSFEDIDNKETVTHRPVSAGSLLRKGSQRSCHSIHSVQSTRVAEDTEPATVEIDMSDSPAYVRTETLPVGPSAFKTTSLDDPQFYAQTTSPAQSYKSSRANIHAGKYGAKDNDRDPDNVNDIVKVEETCLYISIHILITQYLRVR